MDIIVKQMQVCDDPAFLCCKVDSDQRGYLRIRWIFFVDGDGDDGDDEVMER